jgi:hypothetical protein
LFLVDGCWFLVVWGLSHQARSTHRIKPYGLHSPGGWPAQCVGWEGESFTGGTFAPQMHEN